MEKVFNTQREVPLFMAILGGQVAHLVIPSADDAFVGLAGWDHGAIGLEMDEGPLQISIFFAQKKGKKKKTFARDESQRYV